MQNTYSSSASHLPCNLHHTIDLSPPPPIGTNCLVFVSTLNNIQTSFRIPLLFYCDYLFTSLSWSNYCVSSLGARTIPYFYRISTVISRLEYTGCSTAIYWINERIYWKNDFVPILRGHQVGDPKHQELQTRIRFRYYCSRGSNVC